MKGIRGATLLALAVGMAGLATAGVAGPATAATAATTPTTPTTLYVEPGSGCSDSGPGSSAEPFCTISKAAAVVQAGQTVNIGYGGFPEQVTITAKGTAAAPITFVGQSGPQFEVATQVGTDGSTAKVAHAFVFNGAQHVVLKNIAMAATGGDVQIENSQNITVDDTDVINVLGSGYSTADVQVGGTSSGVTISRNTLLRGVQVGAGATGTTISTNEIASDPLAPGNVPEPSVQATDAPGTIITSNTIGALCAPGVDLEGTATGSTGSTIENNIITYEPACANVSSPIAGITVAPGSTSSTTSDYNIVYSDASSGNPTPTLYDWNGNGYTSLADFTAATGEGGHDLAVNPNLVYDQNTMGPYLYGTDAYPSEGAPEIDSANASAPGELTTDVSGLPRVNDPLVPDTGTAPGSGSGTGVYDRGAYEFQDQIAFVPPKVVNTPGAGPQTVTITTGVTNAWSNNVTYTYNFQDGTPNVVTTATTVQHTFADPGNEDSVITANDGYASTSDNDQNGYVSADLGANYTPMTPVRLLDTRAAVGVTTKTPVPANSTVTLQVAGVDGIPPTGVSAITMNVTAANPTSSGFLTVYPNGEPLPDASNVNFTPGEIVPNLVTIPVTDGKVDLHNSGTGTVNIIADAEGYYSASGSGYKAITPIRVLDTRTPTGVPTKAPVAANGLVKLNLSADLPTGTTAVTMNVTVTNPTASGVITAYPDGAPLPTASSLNYTASDVVPNLVTVPVTDGIVDLYNGSTGTTNLVADLEGYFGTAASGATDSYMPYPPTRVLDTRDYGTDPAPLAANATLKLGPWLQNYSPPPANAVGAVMNFTVTQSTAAGVLTVYPDGAPVPTASNLNYTAAQTVPNLVSTSFGPDDGVDVLNGSTGSTEVVVDLEGFFLGPLT